MLRYVFYISHVFLLLNSILKSKLWSFKALTNTFKPVKIFKIKQNTAISKHFTKPAEYTRTNMYSGTWVYDFSVVHTFIPILLFFWISFKCFRKVRQNFDKSYMTFCRTHILCSLLYASDVNKFLIKCLTCTER